MEAKQQQQKEVLTRKETAEALGCSVGTIDRMRVMGRLPSIHLAGRSVRIPRWAVDRIIRFKADYGAILGGHRDVGE